MEGPCADSVEKREPASDLAIVVVDSLKRLTPTGRLEKRTHAPQHRTSITSSALASSCKCDEVARVNSPVGECD